MRQGGSGAGLHRRGRIRREEGSRFRLNSKIAGSLDGRVLVVDDSPPNQELLCELLQAAGYEVQAASDGVGALELLSRSPFDVVLLDVQMPGMDGFEVLERVRQRFDPVELPVIMVTGRDSSEDIVRALGKGATDYITKPVDAAVALARVRTQVTLGKTAARLKEATLELSRRNQVLQELNMEKNEFVGMAAHDLRNPLSIIQGYADYLCMAGDRIGPEKLRKFLDEIRTSSRFMLRLVNDLLTVARIEAGHLHLERASTDLVSLVRNSVQLNGALSARKQIEVRFSSAHESIELPVDAHKIEQVLNNLLCNATKFSHPGTHVDVHLDWIETEARIQVKDRGQGIPAEEIERLFRPFHRSSVKSTAGEESTGLGLVIVRRIVEGHGGRIWVESTVGIGSTFHVSLPDPARVQSVSPSGSASVPATSRGAGPPED